MKSRNELSTTVGPENPGGQPLPETEYDKAWREFHEFITDETADKWSSERIKTRDEFIGKITAASKRRHGISESTDTTATQS